MNNWIAILYGACFAGFYLLQCAQDRKNVKEIQRIHDEYRKERQELLDRIMSNNIAEFKSMSGAIPTKKSENGNFLVDRMERSIQRTYNEHL